MVIRLRSLNIPTINEATNQSQNLRESQGVKRGGGQKAYPQGRNPTHISITDFVPFPGLMNA
jgi:hypothetical protein